MIAMVMLLWRDTAASPKRWRPSVRAGIGGPVEHDSHRRRRARTPPARLRRSPDRNSNVARLSPNTTHTTNNTTNNTTTTTPPPHGCQTDLFARVRGAVTGQSLNNRLSIGQGRAKSTQSEARELISLQLYRRTTVLRGDSMSLQMVAHFVRHYTDTCPVVASA